VTVGLYMMGVQVYHLNRKIEIMDKGQLNRAKRLKEIGRDIVYHKALQKGEDLMPCDVVNIINTICPKLNIADKEALLKDVYNSCGFYLDNEKYF
jgi:hypothetical protein